MFSGLVIVNAFKPLLSILRVLQYVIHLQSSGQGYTTVELGEEVSVKHL